MLNRDLICTPFELKQFAFSLFNDNVTAFNFARFIECKSGFKYTVIEIEFILDAFKIFEEQARVSYEFNEDFQSKWAHLDIPKLKTQVTNNDI